MYIYRYITIMIRPEAMLQHNEDGSVNWVVGGFIAGFTIIVIWVVLQVYIVIYSYIY